MGCVKNERPVHRFSGERWRTNSVIKKHLAIDFKSRCAYCDDLDFYCGGQRNFHVEHFAPKEKFPELKYIYQNLMYSCPYCNSAKSDRWPSDDPFVSVIDDMGFVSPCTEEYDQHLDRTSNGKIVAKTKLGQYMINNLKLYLYYIFLLAFLLYKYLNLFHIF